MWYNSSMKKIMKITSLILCVLLLCAMVISCKEEQKPQDPAAMTGEELMAFTEKNIVEVKAASLGSDSYSNRATAVVYKSTRVDGEDETVVVTNCHVGGADYQNAKFMVRFYGSAEYTAAEIFCHDQYNDILFLKCSYYVNGAIDYSAASSDLATVKKGSAVMVIGNQGGEGIAAFDGIISRSAAAAEVYDDFAADKSKKKIVPAIQTTAPIYDGCSGGGLFDMFGNLLGITTYKYKTDSGEILSGINYAVPIGIAHAVFAAGEKEISIIDARITRTGAGAYNLTIIDLGLVLRQEENGNLVVSSNSGGGDIQEGDIIKSIGGKVIDSITGLIVEVCAYNPQGSGAELSLDVSRSGERVTVTYENYKKAI